MAGELVQTGTLLEVGLAGISYANFEVQSISGPIRTADKSESKDAAEGATRTRFFKNPRRSITITGLVKNDGSRTELAAIEALKPGDLILLATAGPFGTRTNENWITEDMPTFERGEAQGDGVRCSITATREDSMAATYGTS